jgi:hypothetical protein
MQLHLVHSELPIVLLAAHQIHRPELVQLLTVFMRYLSSITIGRFFLNRIVAIALVIP